MLENYITYLKFIDEKLTRFFNSQKPYIYCKKGCSKCCKNAQFPYSQIEMQYLLTGIINLDDYQQEIISQNVQKILEQKSQFEGEKFKYDCPLLINNECSVYEYRGIVCRTFGLMCVGKDGKIQVPFCCYDGFNYSNVVDDSEKKFLRKNLKS